MLIFHEGLPRSGKSFAAIKDHIIPALQKGRKVFAYIEGLNHEKIAQAAEITIEDCNLLLVQINADQVPTIYDHIQNDSLVVIDELQDFWPTSRQKLEPDITKFITQHGHRGLDVLLMGQVINDCHALWRNRVDQLVHFYKRDAIGKADEYKWSVQKRDSKQKFQEVTSGVCKYDPKYFGCYASHTAGTENKVQYEDKRANVWNSSVMKKTLPTYATIALVALGVVIWAFQGGIANANTKKPEEVQKTQPVAPLATAPQVAQQPAQQPIPKPEAIDDTPKGFPDVIDDFTAKYRIRVAGTIQSKGKTAGYIEWRDTDNGVKEILSFQQISGLGWMILVSPDGQIATLQKVNKKYYATAWPIDDYRGRASQNTQQQIQPSSNNTVTNTQILASAKP